MKAFFSKEIVAQQLEKLQGWVLVELPVLVGLIVGLLIVLRIAKYAIKRLKKTLLKHAEKNEKVHVGSRKKDKYADGHSLGGR